MVQKNKQMSRLDRKAGQRCDVRALIVEGGLELLQLDAQVEDDSCVATLQAHRRCARLAALLFIADGSLDKVPQTSKTSFMQVSVDACSSHWSSRLAGGSGLL